MHQLLGFPTITSAAVRALRKAAEPLTLFKQGRLLHLPLLSPPLYAHLANTTMTPPYPPTILGGAASLEQSREFTMDCRSYSNYSQHCLMVSTQRAVGLSFSSSKWSVSCQLQRRGLGIVD